MEHTLLAAAVTASGFAALGVLAFTPATAFA